MINLGDSAVPYHEDFLFYITSKLRNPYYTPETAVKVTLLNFAITEDGLIQQLLGVVVAEERPDLAQMKDQLVVNNAAMNKQMSEIESNILRLLAESTGDILEDETLINTLAESKKTSSEVAAKLKEAEVRPAAWQRGSHASTRKQSHTNAIVVCVQATHACKCMHTQMHARARTHRHTKSQAVMHIHVPSHANSRACVRTQTFSS